MLSSYVQRVRRVFKTPFQKQSKKSNQSGPYKMYINRFENTGVEFGPGR